MDGSTSFSDAEPISGEHYGFAEPAEPIQIEAGDSTMAGPSGTVEKERCGTVPAPELRPVLVTTRGCGIFFGYTADINGFSINLGRARAYVDGACVGGFTDLATNGPRVGAQIGERISRVYLREVTSIIAIEPAAVEIWESTPSHEVSIYRVSLSASDFLGVMDARADVPRQAEASGDGTATA